MAITAAVAVAGAAAISQNQKNKAAAKANQAQQGGIENATEDVNAAYDTAGNKIQTIADAGMGQRQNVEGGINTALGQLNTGNQTLANQQGNLNVNQFLDPSMKFQQQEGLKALEASAAARGGLLSGAAMKQAIGYSQNLAQTNYNNAVQQALNARGQQIDIGRSQQAIGIQGLQASTGLYDKGLSAVGQQAGMDIQQGQDNANLEMSAANAQAAREAATRGMLGTGVSAGLSAYGTSVLSAASKGNGSAYFSDERLKEEVSKITDADVDEFLNLSPATYEYTDEAKEEEGAPEGRKAGVMAQDLEKSKIGKTLVREDERGNKKVDIPSTVSALLATAAIQEKRIKKLEGKK